MTVMPSYTTSTMEDDHFGADGHAIARCSSFSLDFEGVLEASADREGALHHQICEFLQRLDGEQAQAEVQENLQHTVHGGCFSTPAPYQPFLNFLPGDSITLQPDTNTSSVELEPRQLSENSLHQIQNYGSHIRNPVQTKQFTVEDSRLLPASMGASAPPPRQLWNTDLELQTADLLNRAPFQLQLDALASQRRFVYSGAPDGQACIPSAMIPGEFSTCASSSCSPTNIAASSNSFQSRLPQKAEDVLQLSELERRIGKSKRVPDQAGHIIRERLRRDNMMSKFLMLESLLPPGPKRDRATVVEHSIQHVKNLHHRKKDLQQKRTEMANATRAALSLGPRLAAQKATATMHPFEIDKKISETNDIAKTTGSFFEKVEVHLNLPREIVVEVTCRSDHAHFQSQLFGALERLRMDVAQCSFSRARGLILCSIVLRPQGLLDPSVTSDDIARALKRAIIIYNAG